MSVFRNLLTGLVSALASILIVVGALSISTTEGFKLTIPTPVEESTGTPLPPVTPQPVITASGATPQPSPTQPPPTLEATVTLYAPTACPIPDGWREYLIQPGDSLDRLAEQYGISTARLMRANCLVTQTLLTGTVLYLPPQTAAATFVPYPTATITCGVPYGWIRYIVKSGDTLFNLSLIYGVSVLDLQYANCLQNSFIWVGEEIYVPNVATRTPRYSPTPPVTATPTRTRVPPTPPPTATVPTPLVPNPTSVSVTSTPAPSSTPVPTTTLASAPTVGSAPTEAGTSNTTPVTASSPAASTANP